MLLVEFIGGLLLVLGLVVCWVSIFLFIIMVVVMVIVYVENGWLVIVDVNSWFVDGILLMNLLVMEVLEKLVVVKLLLEEYGYIEWFISSGNFVIFNNGIEFVVIYFVMLFVLLCFGVGCYISIDYYLFWYIVCWCGL